MWKPFKDWGAEQFAFADTEWPKMTTEEREITARLCVSTVGTIERQLQFYRKFYTMFADSTSDIPINQGLPYQPEAPPPMPVNIPNVGMRTAVFDLECTDFTTDGYAGLLVCCSVLPLDTV